MSQSENSIQTKLGQVARGHYTSQVFSKGAKITYKRNSTFFQEFTYIFFWVAVVQWSAFGCANLASRVRSPDIHWPFVIIWYYHRVAKDYPHCCHTVLRRDLQCLYAFEALAAISLSSFSTYSKENINIQGVSIKKSKNLRQITGKRQVHPASIKPTGANGSGYRTKL